MNHCPNIASAHDSLKNRNLEKKISNSTKTQYSKKKIRINIIINIIKPSIKSSVNGFSQISWYETEKNNV